MKRRTFLQSAIAAVSGVLGLSVKGQAVVVTNQTEPESTWESLQTPVTATKLPVEATKQGDVYAIIFETKTGHAWSGDHFEPLQGAWNSDHALPVIIENGMYCAQVPDQLPVGECLIAYHEQEKDSPMWGDAMCGESIVKIY